jgi:hypothetical protein
MGLLVVAAGLVPTLAAFDVILSDDMEFNAPRWLAGAIGSVFVLVGLWLTISRAPDWPLAALLRIFLAPLLLAACAAYSAAVVLAFRRVHAGPATRALFLALAVLFALAALRAAWEAARGLRRRPPAARPG